MFLFKLWDGRGAGGGDRRLQRKEWEAGVKGLKRTALSRDELAAEWLLVDADGKGAALFGEFCRWFRCYKVHSFVCFKKKTKMLFLFCCCCSLYLTALQDKR